MKKHLYTLLLLLVVGCGDKKEPESKQIAMNSFRESIRSIVAKELGIPVERVQENATFTSLGADDLDLVEITMCVEEEHGISISDDSLVVASGTTRADQLAHTLTVKIFVDVASASEKAPPSNLSATSDGPAPVGGAYSQLVKIKLEPDQTIVFIPSLSMILLQHEKKRGVPLTKEQVLAIRNEAPAITLPKEVADKLAEKRGYRDLNAENCWPEWQKFRLSFKRIKTEQKD